MDNHESWDGKEVDCSQANDPYFKKIASRISFTFRYVPPVSSNNENESESERDKNVNVSEVEWKPSPGKDESEKDG